MLITTPADYHLLRRILQVVGARFTIRAVVLGAQPLDAVYYWLGAGPQYSRQSLQLPG